ncbi:MAG: restriction endonuclease subunit S [Gammaproteobacteria bacterium]
MNSTAAIASQREWKSVLLKDAAHIGAGNSAPQKKELFENGIYPFIRTSDVGRVRFGNIDGASDLLNDDGISKLRLVPAGTVLMPKSGASTFLNHRVEMSVDGYVSSHLATITARQDVAEPRYLLYYLSTVKAQDLIQDHKYPSLTLVIIGNIFIPLPPLEEQKRIVAVLDQIFAALDRARADAEANLADAQGFFLSALRDVFSNDSRKWLSDTAPLVQLITTKRAQSKRSKAQTQTGGRGATTRPIEGNYSLSVLRPHVEARPGWVWSPLSDMARLESGHTPSRKHPEYWGGDIGWIGIRDAGDHHGGKIFSTREQTNQRGIANSSARILPKGTVCLSRTASVGYVVVMGRDMATSQDFVNWICGDHLEPDFLKFLLLAQGDKIREFASGSVHQTIYFPEVKAFHICHPSRDRQKEICNTLSAIGNESSHLESRYQTKLSDIADLRQSILQKAFAGELT